MSTKGTLDERIYRDLKSIQEELEGKGELPSRQQLEQYYRNFRSRPGTVCESGWRRVAGNPAQTSSSRRSLWSRRGQI